jgi:hypothetical protein
MTTVLGQLAVYTGRQLTWEDARQSKFAYPPSGQIRLDMDPPVQPGTNGVYPVAIPGTTKLI